PTERPTWFGCGSGGSGSSIIQATEHEFFARFARAKHLGWLSRADGLVHWSEHGTGDVNRDRLYVDTMKWLLSKALPKIYGDRFVQEIVGPNGGPIARTNGSGPPRRLPLLSPPEVGGPFDTERGAIAKRYRENRDREDAEHAQAQADTPPPRSRPRRSLRRSRRTRSSASNSSSTAGRWRFPSRRSFAGDK